MTEASIYQHVRDKLVTHGADRTVEGRLVLEDPPLFALFVALERARRGGSFDTVQQAAARIESHLRDIDKRHLMAFTWLYLRFWGGHPVRVEADEPLPDGRIRKSWVVPQAVTDEDMLIWLWACVHYEQEGETFLRVVYAAADGQGG